MAIIDKFAWEKKVLEGINQAKSTDKAVLVSIVEKITNYDPVKFYAINENDDFEESFFWKAADANKYLVGLGSAKLIRSENEPDQFEQITRDWQQIKENSLVFNEYNKTGTGPLLFGGLSFDPLKKKTILWEKYNDALFYIPTLMLTKSEDDYYITFNHLCTKEENDNPLKDYKNLFDKLSKYANKDLVLSRPKITKEREVNPEQWKNTVMEAERELHHTESLRKVVLARELRLYFEENVSIAGTLDYLLKEQANSYIFALQSGSNCFLGATPERLVRKEGEEILSTCLAGSIARGKTVEEDEELGNTLLNDNKNLIEHQYVVDMVKEAMRETSVNVNIPDRPTLLKVRDIQHLYTPVTAREKKGVSLLRIVDRLHPTPAIGGLPKVEAIEKIREIEELDRGLYAGPIGWLDYRENGEFAVALRSALVQADEASLFAGCGVVIDSDAEAEYEETGIKFLPMLTALGRNK